MVDMSLYVLDTSPYRWLFLDLNAYFASVEQQERPDLRGSPVGVVQVNADNACVIAASYEAKRFGVHTGCLVREARQLCPEIAVVEARHQLYVAYHHRVVEAVESVVPVERVMSIDEMRVRLLASEATREAAGAIAEGIKKAIRQEAGECLRCSIGLAPNPFLAKIATEIEKPDGLVFLLPEELEQRIADWRLTQLPGINRRMAVRLNLAGLYTIPQLLTATEQELRNAFGSVVGARWYHLLRGEDLPDVESKRHTLSHEHVLPPEFRTRSGSYSVLLRLTEKAAARLRKEGYAARTVCFAVRGRKERWETQIRLGTTQDTIALIEALRSAWPDNEIKEPMKVSVALYDLIPVGQMSLSLFEGDNRRNRLALTVDSVNARFGKHSVLPAGVFEARNTAPERIAFQKTSLFDEGQEDAA